VTREGEEEKFYSERVRKKERQTESVRKTGREERDRKRETHTHRETERDPKGKLCLGSQ